MKTLLQHFLLLLSFAVALPAVAGNHHRKDHHHHHHGHHDHGKGSKWGEKSKSKGSGRRQNSSRVTTVEISKQSVIADLSKKVKQNVISQEEMDDIVDELNKIQANRKALNIVKTIGVATTAAVVSAALSSAVTFRKAKTNTAALVGIPVLIGSLASIPTGIISYLVFQSRNKYPTYKVYMIPTHTDERLIVII